MDKQIRPITAVPAELLTLEQVRAHLKIDSDTEGSPPTHPDDAMLTVLITVAREHVENYTGRSVVHQQYELVLDAFPSGNEIDLQTHPVTAINSVVYTDTLGAAQIMSPSDYMLDDYSAPCKLMLYFDVQWPVTKAQPNAIKITFTGGATDGNSPDTFPCPMVIKHSMLLVIGHLYENRQSVVSQQRYELPEGVKALLQPYRINMGM